MSFLVFLVIYIIHLVLFSVELNFGLKKLVGAERIHYGFEYRYSVFIVPLACWSARVLNKSWAIPGTRAMYHTALGTHSFMHPYCSNQYCNMEHGGRYHKCREGKRISYSHMRAGHCFVVFVCHVFVLNPAKCFSLHE